MNSLIEKKEKLDQLIFNREKLINGMFYYAFGLIFVFGIPAGLGVFIGKFLIGTKIALVISLVCAFILSWLLVLRHYSKLSNRTSLLDSQIRSLRGEIQEIEKNTANK